MDYWLLKSEPSTFSIDDLAAAPRRRTAWDGVRNYQARNYIRDRMRRGDQAIFYHSSCAQPGAVGIVKVVRTAYPDPTQFDPEHKYHDPGSSQNDPRWYVVDVQLVRTLRRVITLSELRNHADDALSGFGLLARGNRLSVLPVTADQWRFILSLE